LTLPSATLNPAEPQKLAAPNMNVAWDYSMPVTESEYGPISNAIQSNPEEEPYRYASALRFSKEYGLSMENAMVRLDELTQWQTGKVFTPTKTTWKSIVDSIEIGKLQPVIAEAQRQFKYAELAGQDTSAIEAQIQQYEQTMAQLGDSTPRSLVTQAIKFGAESLPYTLNIALKGASKGMLAGLGAAGVAALAGVATAGALPVSIATSIIAVATAAGTAFSFEEAFKTMEGGEYYRLRKNGVPVDKALAVSNISSWVQAGIEISLGTVASKFGLSTNTLTSKVLAKLAISGKWGAAGAFVANLTGQALEEGAEEAAQSISSWVADIAAAELADVQAPERTMSVVKEAMLSAKGGFLAGLILGGAGTAMHTISDARTMGAIKSDAQTMESKEAFSEKYSEAMPEGMNQEEWKETISQLWKENRPAEEQAVKEIDITSEATGDIRKLSSGRLYARESTEVDILPDGSEARSLLIGDPLTGDRYGNITYTFKDNTIDIDEVRFGTDYQTSAKDAVLELARQNPGVEITWNPETDNLMAVKEAIITEQGSLNPFQAGRVESVDARMKLESQIAKAMPKLDAPQRIAASLLLDMRANAKGQTLEQYMDAQFGNEVFGGTIKGKRGGIEFKQTEQGVKALIYAGKNADFSTFTHEAFHLFRREMSQSDKLASALTEASKSKEFAQYVQQNQKLLKLSPKQATAIVASFGKEWTRAQEELSAQLWELYLKEGKAPTSKLEAFFEKFAQWFGKIYRGLTGRVQLDSRIREVFDSLIDSDSPLAQEARQAQQQELTTSATIFQTDAYHGSPYTFDRFSTEHIGTGEGQQAYGWGLYFTDLEEVARWYATEYARPTLRKDGTELSDEQRQTLINDMAIDLAKERYYDSAWESLFSNVWENDNHDLWGILKLSKDEYLARAESEDEARSDFDSDLSSKSNTKEFIKYLDEEIANYAKYEAVDEVETALRGYLSGLELLTPQMKEYFDRNGIEIYSNRNLYNVSINKDREDLFMDWNKPLSEEVKNKLREPMKTLTYPKSEYETYGVSDISELVDSILNKSNGAMLYADLADITNDQSGKKASIFLMNAGIDGNRYPAVSHGTGDGSKGYNYVVFDENKITIENSILFQDDIITEASQFSTWEDFKDGYSSFLEAMYGEVPDMDDDWYRNTWEQANPQGNDELMDDRFVQSMNSDGLLPFLKEMGRILTERVEAPDDQDMADYNERMADLKFRIQKASPTIVSNAIGSISKTLKPTELKKIRTTIANASRLYRDLYADVMSNPEMKPIVLDEFLPSITEPEFEAVERISIADRIRLSERIEAKALKEKLLSGEELFDGDAEKIVRQMDTEIKQTKEEIAKLQAEYKEARISLSESDRRGIDLQEQIDDARKALTKAQKNIQKRIAKNQEVSKTLIDERKSLSEQVKTLMAEFNQLSKSNRTISAEKKREAVNKATDTLKEKQKALYDARKVREYKTKLASKIMSPVSQAVDYKYKLPILAIQATLDPKFRTGKVKYGDKLVQLDDIKAIVETVGDYDISQTLPARIADRLSKRSLNEITVAELEEIASRVATLRKTGRLIQQARSVFQSELANSMRSSIESTLRATGKFIQPPPTGTVEDVKRKRGLLEKSRSMLYATWNIERKAQMLDNMKKGMAYDLLVDRPRDAYRMEKTNVNRRYEAVMQSMKNSGIEFDDAYKQVQVGDSTYTRSDLAMFYMGAKNDQSRAALAYGNLVSPIEKETLTDGEIRETGDNRLAEVLEVAERELSKEMRLVMDAIDNDFSSNFDRLNTVSIREFNMPVSRVDNYVPIRRMEMTGDDLAAAVADDILNMNAGAMPTGIERGITKERVNIAPRHQKPMKLDLLGTWQEAVEMQEHFIAYAELGREMNRVFKGPNSASMRSTIVGTFGNALLDDIDDAINEYVNPNSFKRLDRNGKLIKTLRGNLGAAYLTWKTSNIILQLITSPMPFLSEVNPIELAKAYFDITTHPMEVINHVNELSIVMKERTMDPIVQLLKDEQAKYSGAKMQAFRKFQELGMTGLVLADKWAVAGGWLAVFRKNLKKYDTATVEAVKASVKAADDAVLRTQPSGRAEELAPLFKSGGEGMKILTQFQAALNIIWQNTTFDMNLFAKQKQYAKLIGQVVGYVMAGAILGAVAQGFDDDDEDADKIKKMLYYSFTQFTDSVPLIGSLTNNVAESLITGDKPYVYPSSFYPATTELMKGVIDLTQANWTSAVKNLSEGFGYATGLPVSGTKQIFRAFDEGAEALLGRIE